MKIPKARKMPSGKWNIQLRIGGQSISITKPTKRECEMEAVSVKTAWETGGNLNGMQSNLTVYDAMDRYIQDRSNVLSPSTIRTYKSMRDNAFQEISGRKVKTIRDNEWAGIVNRAAKTRSAKALTNEWMFLRSALKHAAERRCRMSVCRRSSEMSGHFLIPNKSNCFLTP